MLEGFNDRLFLLPRCLRRPAALTLRQVIVLPINDSSFPLRRRDIQVSHMESVLLLHSLPDMLVGSHLLEPGHVHVFEREFNFDILTRNVSLGKLDNRLEHCLIFQGEFLHFLAVYRDGKDENDFSDPAAVIRFFGIQIDPINDRPHEFSLFRLAVGIIQLLEG